MSRRGQLVTADNGCSFAASQRQGLQGPPPPPLPNALATSTPRSHSFFQKCSRIAESSLSRMFWRCILRRRQQQQQQRQRDERAEVPAMQVPVHSPCLPPPPPPAPVCAGLEAARRLRRPKQVEAGVEEGGGHGSQLAWRAGAGGGWRIVGVGASRLLLLQL